MSPAHLAQSGGDRPPQEWMPRPGARSGRATAEAQRVNEQLSATLASRMVIEQATGVLAGHAGVDLAEAFSRLRAYARDSKLRLTDVAQATIAGTLDPLG